MPDETRVCDLAVIGAGPAGLMAAEAAAAAGVRRVHVFDAMPSAGRKFLLAGKGGLNLTHSEPLQPFVARYGGREAALAPLVQAFGPQQLREWAQGLGVETFVGTSGRVFPTDMKAAPLLRAWLQRLRAAGVQLHMRQRWLGWAQAPHEGGPQLLHFATPAGPATVQARAVVLALGGASWARLGSDGAWVPLLSERGVAIAPLAPANCGFDVLGAQAPAGETRRDFLRELLGRQEASRPGWSPHFVERFAGQPFKAVALSFTDGQGRHFQRRGEFVATATGVEGSLIYAVSHLLRDEIAAHGHATFHLDLLPDHAPERVLAEVRHPRGARSLSSHLKSRLGLGGIKMAVLHEVLGKEGVQDAERLAAAIKALPVTAVAPRPLDESISTAGGVAFEQLDEALMLRPLSGVFAAGEMLDWEAPTGGYLLTACFATGLAAGQGAARWLGSRAGV
ncbi:TIGR03862 family flavoprotein [Pulveribacter suum]|uniref:Aminoacetone oxidase family FAD-binding enzyme n=1 Tax=Pulveribacter suum TaxID=2116657 RepID=A0A2P1NKL9_9BURK|nr:TIGR03862 family flavoprotein [Pulveribacter suum]AVP57566.1 aminoacetone oxidase family FAD-binding enzyme [Pulveribacter suum]